MRASNFLRSRSARSWRATSTTPSRCCRACCSMPASCCLLGKRPEKGLRCQREPHARVAREMPAYVPHMGCAASRASQVDLRWGSHRFSFHIAFALPPPPNPGPGNAPAMLTVLAEALLLASSPPAADPPHSNKRLEIESVLVRSEFCERKSGEPPVSHQSRTWLRVKRATRHRYSRMTMVPVAMRAGKCPCLFVCGTFGPLLAAWAHHLNRQAARGRLSACSEKGGGLGIVELRDDPSLAASKIVHLAELIRNAKRCVVLTGAGISTSAGVSDFRGPNGVWTSESKGVAPPASKSFDTVHPTFTHMALAALVEAGRVELVVSQNVDGLHLRSGLPRARYPPLHVVPPDPPGPSGGIKDVFPLTTAAPGSQSCTGTSSSRRARRAARSTSATSTSAGYPSARRGAAARRRAARCCRPRSLLLAWVFDPGRCR